MGGCYCWTTNNPLGKTHMIEGAQEDKDDGGDGGKVQKNVKHYKDS